MQRHELLLSFLVIFALFFLYEIYIFNLLPPCVLYVINRLINGHLQKKINIGRG